MNADVFSFDFKKMWLVEGYGSIDIFLCSIGGDDFPIYITLIHTVSRTCIVPHGYAVPPISTALQNIYANLMKLRIHVRLREVKEVGTE